MVCVKVFEGHALTYGQLPGVSSKLFCFMLTFRENPRSARLIDIIASLAKRNAYRKSATVGSAPFPNVLFFI